MSVRRMLTVGALVCLGALCVPILQPVTTRAQGGPPVRTDALVLVNSTSAGYPDFERLVQPYLDNFGVPYTVLDIVTSQIPESIGDFSLLIIGHRQIDAGGGYVDRAEQDAIAAAVNQGTGLVNFDNDLWTNSGAPRYQFVQSVFNFGRGGSTTSSGVAFSPTPATTHYITARHSADETIATGTMRLPGITLPATATAVAVSGDQPLITVTSSGSGHAVQWGSYDWMSHAVLGPIHGLDDLMWRSLAWAAHKPFVMQALPPILTMRVDDEKGPLGWVHTANDFGFKPWLGLFFEQVSDAEAADLSGLTNAGQATASIHAFSDVGADGADGTFFYFNDAVGQNFSADTVAFNFALGAQWHREHSIPISKFALPHYYEFGSNVFDGLSGWGVECVGTLLEPGRPYYGSAWVENGPYRRFESGDSDSGAPLYYADFLSVPGHTEFDGRFFNLITEIRDDNGYEWYPNNDVVDTIGHGTRQLTRAFDSRVLGTLFTHGYYIQSITSSNWRDIMQGIQANITDYGPVSMTMDDACQYVRAVATSSILSGTYDAAAQTVRTVLTGRTDVPTSLSLFTQSGDQITEWGVAVPAFSGSTEIVSSLGGAGGDVTPPQISGAAAGQVTASGAAVTWTTDEPATSQVEYGTTTAYGSATTLDATLATSHSQLLTGLSPSTVYHYRVLSRDGAGNPAVSTDATFTTAATAPSLTINDVSVTEGNSGSVNAVFTVSLSAASGLPVSVAYATANGAATAGSDYTAKTGTLSFAPGVTTQTLSVAVLGDALAEPSETFAVNLTQPGNATIADSQGVGTILDNDGVPSISIKIACPDDAHQAPVLATTTNAADIGLSDGRWTEFLYVGGRSFATVVAGVNEYEKNGLPPMRFFASGIANGTYDVYANLYTQVTGRNMRYYYGYAPGETKRYYVDTVGGSGGASEHTEYRLGSVTVTDGTFSLYAQDADLLSGSYAVFGWAWIRLVPVGGDVTPPQISGAAAGQVTASGAAVTWTTDEPATSQVEYGTTTAYGSATTLDATLATSHSQLLTGLSPSTVYHYRVLSRDGAGNPAVSTDATFTTAATAPSLTINDVSVTEGNSGSVNAVFTVSLSAASGLPVSVAYATANGAATAGSDYTAKTGTLSFAPGVTTQTLSVAVLGDALAEPSETFAVNLTQPGNATIADSQGVGTILDNDPTPTLTINDVSVTEGNSGSVNAVFTVSLSAASGLPVSVAYATANGAATAGSDYTAKTGTLSFAPGVTTQTLSVAVLGDALAEPSETFAVNLTQPGNATIADSQGVGTILDNDGVPSISIGDVTVTEGNSGSVNAVFAVSLSAPYPLAVSVSYATTNGTALAGTDYTTTSGVLVFAAGVTTQTLSVAVLGDALAEPTRPSPSTSPGPQNATLADSQGVGTILDNDPTPTLTINDVSVTEGNSGSVNAVFTVSLSAASGLPVSVAYATANGAATAGSDYTAKTGTLSFAPGVTTQTLSVAVLGDALAEPSETFAVNLTQPGNATIADSQGVGTILDNDGVPSISIKIACPDDAHQAPVLATTTNAADIGLSDGRWTEFLYVGGRSFATVVAGVNEYEKNGLPPMRFFASGIANGTYDVYANLYTQVTGRNMRYYYGYAPGETKRYYVDTVGGSGGASEHTEYRLGSVTVTDGTFSLYAQDADLLSGSYAVFGWAWIRLVPVG